MGTQKTSTGSGDGFRSPGDPADEVEIGGRKLQRVDLQKEAARAYGGQMGPETPMDGPPMQVDPDEKKKLDAMMPEFLKQAAVKEQQVQTPEAGGAKEDAVVMKRLSDRYVEAKQRGDDHLAAELKKLMGEVLGEQVPKRRREAKPEHTILQKLRQNLGLERITPAEVEWGGFKWHFRVSPAAVERWVVEMYERDVSSVAAIKIAAALVGIDDVPLYEVFGIETATMFESEDVPGGIPIRVFEKRCEACNEILNVEVKECPACGSLHDPFDMPLPLRLQCIDRVHNWFLSDFGPFEELNALYELLREKLPDRLTNKDEIYPFLKLSPESLKTTNTTPSGDGQ